MFSWPQLSLFSVLFLFLVTAVRSEDKLSKEELDKFYVAEGYHQDYFENNPNAPYCTFIIAPKINKLRKKGTIWDD